MRWPIQNIVIVMNESTAVASALQDVHTSLAVSSLVRSTLSFVEGAQSEKWERMPHYNLSTMLWFVFLITLHSFNYMEIHPFGFARWRMLAGAQLLVAVGLRNESIKRNFINFMLRFSFILLRCFFLLANCNCKYTDFKPVHIGMQCREKNY